jgi:hypothetical protein
MLQSLSHTGEGKSCWDDSAGATLLSYAGCDLSASIWVGDVSSSHTVIRGEALRELFGDAPTQLWVFDFGSVTKANLVRHAFAERIYSRHFETVFGNRRCIISDVKDVVQSRWLEVAYAHDASLSLAQMGAIVDDLTGLFQAGRFDEVDAVLGEALPDRMSVDAITAISRISYKARVHLHRWPDFIAG